MSLRCKVGDLAIVIDSHFPENLGALVEVIKPGREPGVDLPHWHVIAQRPLKLATRRWRIYHSADALAFDKSLLPVGSKDPIIELTEEELDHVSA